MPSSILPLSSANYQLPKDFFHLIRCFARKQLFAVVRILENSDESGQQLEVGCVDGIRYERQAEYLDFRVVDRIVVGDDAVVVLRVVDKCQNPANLPDAICSSVRYRYAVVKAGRHGLLAAKHRLLGVFHVDHNARQFFSGNLDESFFESARNAGTMMKLSMYFLMIAHSTRFLVHSRVSPLPRPARRMYNVTPPAKAARTAIAAIESVSGIG